MIEGIFRRLSSVIVTRRRAIILVGLILIGASLFGATRIEMATGIETWISTDSQTYEDYQRFNEHFGSNVIVVMVTGDDVAQLLQPSNLEAMEYIEDSMRANPNVISALGPAYLTKQGVAYMTGTAALPDDESMLQMIIREPESGRIRPEFEGVLPDDRHALIAIVLEGGISRDAEAGVVQETERTVSTVSFVGAEAVVTGGPAITAQIQDLMASSMRNMFIVAILLMFLILALIFSVRGFFAWRWLPMGEVGLGIVFTFGAMGLLSVPVTMTTMAAFPILIGLGVDFSIQLHNRYDEETRRGRTLTEAAVNSVTHIGSSMGMALVAMFLGFAALLFSPVPMIRDFGLMLIIGVVACYVVALFFPLPVLLWRDRRRGQKAAAKKEAERPLRESGGLVERGLQRLTPWVIRRRAIIIPIAIALTVAGLVSAPHVKTETDWSNLFSENVQVVVDYKTLQSVAPGTTSANVLVEAEDVTNPQTLAWMVEVEDYIAAELEGTVARMECVADLVVRANGGAMPQSGEEVKRVLEEMPAPLKRNLITNDYTASNIVINLRGEEADQIEKVSAALARCPVDPPSGVNTALTGAGTINMKLFDAMSSGRTKMTLIGVGFVFLGLIVLFRFGLLKALMATVPIGLIIGWSSGLMYLSGTDYNPLTATMNALIVAIGVEYTVLLIMRYYEEREEGREPREAMTTATSRIGRAIVASGLTDIGGFAALLAATDFLMLQAFGIMTVINVSLALVSTLVVLPGLIVSLDSWRDKRQLAKQEIRMEKAEIVDLMEREP